MSLEASRILRRPSQAAFHALVFTQLLVFGPGIYASLPGPHLYDQGFVDTTAPCSVIMISLLLHSPLKALCSLKNFSGPALISPAIFCVF